MIPVDLNIFSDAKKKLTILDVSRAPVLLTQEITGVQMVNQVLLLIQLGNRQLDSI